MKRLGVLVSIIVLTVAGCSSGEERVAGPSMIEVDISDGEITPRGEVVDVTVGEDVAFVVTSDTDEELHVHGEPELLIEVEAGMKDAEFTYSPEVPGRIGVETHGSGVTVVTLVATN